ncbi:MAG TPA: histidine kinase, partial [Acidimicrobiales bacterium]|nr:histidine kinase [Acidimicrobiales bacterium]
MSAPVRHTVTVAAIAAAVAASLGGAAVSLSVAQADNRSLSSIAFNGAVVTAFAVVGAVVVAARPRNTVGWAMLVGGVLWSLGGAGADLAYHGIVASPGSVPDVSLFAVAGSALRSVGWYSITLVVPAAFPDAPLGESRWLSRVLAVILVTGVLDPITDKQADLLNLGNWRNPIAPSHPWDFISALAFLGHVPLSLVATAGVVVLLVRRWRSGDALRRQQLTMLGVAALVTVVAVPFAFAFGGGNWAFGVAALPLPFAIGFAVLARGLYDLRTATNRTLVWLTLSAVVAAMYALVIVGGAGLLHVSRNVSWLPWAAAAAVAVAFGPLRDGLQRAVNRVTFGRWDEPYEVLAGLGQRLEASADMDRLLSAVTIELEGLGLGAVSVADEHGRVVAGRDVPSSDAVELALSAYGHPVGVLRYEAPSTPLRSRDRRLLDDLAGHLGGVLHARRLTDELQQALERLVLAREEERRRLRRDLHDGLGPALAGHLLRLDLIASQVGDGPGGSGVATLRNELRGTVVEVRRVVEGLRPPSLDELGLAGALAETTQRLAAGAGIAVDLHVGELPTLPAAVEVAAYRIVTEAVTNVVRHAEATKCEITVKA